MMPPFHRLPSGFGPFLPSFLTASAVNSYKENNTMPNILRFPNRTTTVTTTTNGHWPGEIVCERESEREI